MSIVSEETTATAASFAVDTTPLPAGANEELAGPPHREPVTMSPVAEKERVSSIDLLRGFSLMGILVMNITSFALPEGNYMFPLTLPHPVFHGPHMTANTVLWFLRWMLAEGKMRALFSMLFGAGVILLTQRAEERGAGIRSADIYTRRNMWLVLFGMLHAYLIWEGDILFYYGTSALLFLFPFRNCRPRTLLWTATALLVLNTVVMGGMYYASPREQKKAADKVNLLLQQGKPITEEQIETLKAWHKTQDNWRSPEQKMYKRIAQHQHGWFSQAADAKAVMTGEIKGAYFGFGDWFGGMLLGMALFRMGFFSLRCSTKTYVWTALLGLGISWPLTLWGCWHLWQHHFDLFATLPLLIPYDLTRITGAIGNAAVLLLMMRFGVMRWVLGRVAAVGQMAFSNYILTSLCMKTLFVWGAWHWFGYVEYYKLYYAVLGMWTVNLVFSALWLRFFQFGPLEWCWRSLTYWKRQPMLRLAEA